MKASNYVPNVSFFVISDPLGCKVLQDGVTFLKIACKENLISFAVSIDVPYDILDIQFIERVFQDFLKWRFSISRGMIGINVRREYFAIALNSVGVRKVLVILLLLLLPKLFFSLSSRDGDDNPNSIGHGLKCEEMKMIQFCDTMMRNTFLTLCNYREKGNCSLVLFPIV